MGGSPSCAVSFCWVSQPDLVVDELTQDLADGRGCQAWTPVPLDSPATGRFLNGGAAHAGGGASLPSKAETMSLHRRAVVESVPALPVEVIQPLESQPQGASQLAVSKALNGVNGHSRHEEPVKAHEVAHRHEMEEEESEREQEDVVAPLKGYGVAWPRRCNTQDDEAPWAAEVAAAAAGRSSARLTASENLLRRVEGGGAAGDDDSPRCGLVRENSGDSVSSVQSQTEAFKAEGGIPMWRNFMPVVPCRDEDGKDHTHSRESSRGSLQEVTYFMGGIEVDGPGMPSTSTPLMPRSRSSTTSSSGNASKPRKRSSLASVAEQGMLGEGTMKATPTYIPKPVDEEPQGGTGSDTVASRPSSGQ